MQLGSLGVALFLLILAISLFTYGLYILNPVDPITGMLLSVIGIFLGIASLLIIYNQLFSGSQLLS